MVSQGASVGIVDRGQASPRAVPSIAVREEGQIGARPSIKTLHRVGRRTIGTDDIWVEGCEMR